MPRIRARLDEVMQRLTFRAQKVLGARHNHAAGLSSQQMLIKDKIC